MNNQNNYLKEIEILERKVQSLENSLSYRLGYVLLNAFKSRKNFLGLFPTLLSLKKEFERRNNIKDESYKIKFYDSLPNFEFINVKKEKPLIAVINNKTATRLILQVSIDGRRARGNLDKALIMKVKFFDENNKQVSLQNIQGLSYSQKTGNYKYINVVPNRISNKEIVATIDIPSKVNKSIIEITTWQGLDIDIKNALIVQQEIIQDEIKEFLIDSTLNVDEEIQFSKQQPRKLSIKIPTRKRIKITSVFNAIQGKGEEKNAAIAIFSFKDIDDKEVNLKNINGLSYSEKFGWYKYISLEHGKIQEVEIAEFRPPETVTQCTITFMTWKGLNITLKNAINVSEYSPWDVDGFDIPKLKASDSSLKIASICDAFTEFSLKFDLNLDRLSRNKWKEQLVENNYSLLLVESAWNGNDGDWKYLTNTEGKAFEELKELVEAFKKKNIKTIFYNKEDSPNYDIFIHIAKLFDVVITSDINCVEKYKKDCQHENVYVMPFAAQPKIHNPIGKIESDDLEIAFAGTWYKNKHADRSKHMPIVLNPSTQHKLTIFNRQSDWTIDDSYEFPKKYQPFLHKKVDYEEMLSIHKMFKILLNTNSVYDSESMFSRRVFEILASSTPVVSTESIGIRKIFKNIVPVVQTEKEAETVIDKLLSDDLYRKKIGHLGHREVMTKHTIKHRFSDIFSKLNIKNDLNVDYPKVTMAIPTNRIENLHYIKENISRQNYPNLEAVIVLNNDKFSIKDVEEFFSEFDWIKVIQLPESETLGACLNASVDASTGEYWSKMDDDNIYLENFISDMMLPFTYSDYKIVIKSTYYAYLEGSKKLILRFPNREHKVVDFGSGSALIVDKKLFEIAKFPDVSVGEDTQWMKTCKEAGYPMYSADAFNYVVMRRADISSHTWQVNDAEVMKGSIQVSDHLDLDMIRV